MPRIEFDVECFVRLPDGGVEPVPTPPDFVAVPLHSQIVGDPGERVESPVGISNPTKKVYRLFEVGSEVRAGERVLTNLDGPADPALLAPQAVTDVPLFYSFSDHAVRGWRSSLRVFLRVELPAGA